MNRLAKYWHDKRGCKCKKPGSFFCIRSYPMDPDWCSIHGWHMLPCECESSAPLSQPAEEIDLKSIKSGFESQEGHQFDCNCISCRPWTT